MKLIFSIMSLSGFLTFIVITSIAFKNKTGKIQIPLIGLGVFLVLSFVTLFFYPNNSKKEITAPKEVKTIAQPKAEENTKTEEKPKTNEPENVDKKQVEIIHGPASKVKGPVNPKYVMNVSYDSSNHVITGSMSVDFINNLDVDLTNLYFNVWGNADVYLKLTKKDANVKIDQVQVNGQPVTYSLDGTALHIPQVSIKKTEKAKVEMNFSVTMPEDQDRFGWNKTTTSLGNWFPILAVYDNEGWNVDPFFAGGESFYSLTGDFDVTFTTEKEQIIATTGTEVGSPKVNGTFATHQYKAVNVRDFAMELDPNYKIKQAKAGNVNINVYYKDEHEQFADSMLNTGIKSIEVFSRKFGAYPWPELDICSMEGWFGGMEYPQLVMISIIPDRKIDDTYIASTTSHEIGHQWFYGIIGDNEYDEPWLDESFATFASSLYQGTLDTKPPLVDEAKLADTHLSATIATFTENQKKGNLNYYMVVYNYGSTVVNDLRKELGDNQFYASMKAYFNEMKFGVSTTADFIRIMQETSKHDLSKFFEDHRVYVSDQQ